MSTEVEAPLTMSDLISSRPRRHVDLFGRPGETTSPDDEGTEQVPADINAILRAARHRRSTDRAAAEESEE